MLRSIFDQNEEGGSSDDEFSENFSNEILNEENQQKERRRTIENQTELITFIPNNCCKNNNNKNNNRNIDNNNNNIDNNNNINNNAHNNNNNNSLHGVYPSIKLQQQKQRGIAHQLWPAAVYLCNFLELHHSEYLTSSNFHLNADINSNGCSNCHNVNENQSMTTSPPTPIIELGAGIGLVGLFVWKAFGCRPVILTDLPEALEGLENNIRLNQLEVKDLQEEKEELTEISNGILARELSWGNETQALECLNLFGIPSLSAIISPVAASVSSSASEQIEERCSPLVLAADCVYWECLFKPLYQTLKTLTDHGCRVLMSHFKRWKKDEKFFAMCRKSMRVTVIEEQIEFVIEEFDGSRRRQIKRIYLIEKL